jgi:hypothetical protein
VLRPKVSRPICLGAGHPVGTHDQILPLFLSDNCFLFVLGRPVWRENGSAICSANCQWSESLRTHNHILLSHPKLQISLFVACYDSQGLLWKYSNSPLHWAAYCRSYFITNGQSVSMSWYRTHLWDLRANITSCRNVAVCNLNSSFCGTPSLTRERVCHLQCNHSMVRVAQNP